MTFTKLRITGADGTPYEIGQPMRVYDQNTLLATIDPVLLRNAGTEVHLEHFHPTRVVREESRHIGRLIFLEVCEFLAENFHQIQAITFSFARPVSMLGGATEQANAGAETVTRIGAVNVQITPKLDARPGLFAVSGIWAYSEPNLAALRVVLEEQRAIYRKDPIVGTTEENKGVRSMLLRLMRPHRV